VGFIGNDTMRLFVALPLPDEVRAGLARWVKSCGAQPGLRWTPVEQLHFTLHFLGEVAGDRVAEITAALGKIEAPTFQVAFERIETLGRGVLAAAAQPAPPFAALAESVRSRLRQFTAESAQSDRAFHPHVTLARARHGATIPKASALPALPALKFTATCFRLYRSELRREGAVHTVAGEWKLG
jgi:2'-5' RNA ligase